MILHVLHVLSSIWISNYISIAVGWSCCWLFDLVVFLGMAVRMAYNFCSSYIQVQLKIQDEDQCSLDGSFAVAVS
jgi:hypothetical protein